jgi:ABC-2 type transport system permease protein
VTALADRLALDGIVAKRLDSPYWPGERPHSWIKRRGRPSIRGNTSWQELFNTLPQTYRAIFTASGQLNLSTPAGYLGIELMGFLGPALMAVYAISAGAVAVAGEEGRGGLEVTLSAPVARGQVLAERAAALLIEIMAVAAATGLAMWVCSPSPSA